jgi:hypothetical protein
LPKERSIVIDLDSKSTPLILFDPNGILAAPLAYISAPHFLACGEDAADRFRVTGAIVGLVQASSSDGRGDASSRRLDQPSQIPRGSFPAGRADLAPGIALIRG